MASNESFWFQAGVATVGPLAAAIVGSGIIGLFIQRIANQAQQRREQLDRRYALAQEMAQAASALYMTTQKYWRAVRGKASATSEVDTLKDELDAQYERSRVDGLVLEMRLQLYFAADKPRKHWHRTMDFLTIRYFQVMKRDTARLYAANEGSGHTGRSAQDLRNPKVVLSGYREALQEAVGAVLVGRFHDEKSLRAAHPQSADDTPEQGGDE